jgi:uncharacterized protein
MFLEAALTNATSAPVLAFVLGLLAVAIKSDLRLPEAVYQGLSIYLLLGIGIKGGVALSEANIQEVWLPILGTLALGLLIPLLAFVVLGTLTKLDTINKGALAAHYGSTSLVTFSAALIFVESQNIHYEGYVTTLLAILEVPGIVVGLLLASRGLNRGLNWGESLREIVTSRSIVLLAGGLVLGLGNWRRRLPKNRATIWRTIHWCFGTVSFGNGNCCGKTITRYQKGWLWTGLIQYWVPDSFWIAWSSSW